MADVYTPTTDEVRAAWAAFSANVLNDYSAAERRETEAEFNRWLTTHDAAVAAVAWDMAVASLVYEDGTPVEVLAVTNPYRNQNTQLGGH